MTLALTICAGYVLGRFICWFAYKLAGVTILHWLEQSAAFRIMVRRNLMREKRLKATLVGPWTTKE